MKRRSSSRPTLDPIQGAIEAARTNGQRPLRIRALPRA